MAKNVNAPPGKKRPVMLWPFYDENGIELQASAKAQVDQFPHHLYRHDARLWKELAAASSGGA